MLSAGWPVVDIFIAIEVEGVTEGVIVEMAVTVLPGVSLVVFRDWLESGIVGKVLCVVVVVTNLMVVAFVVGDLVGGVVGGVVVGAVIGMDVVVLIVVVVVISAILVVAAILVVTGTGIGVGMITKRDRVASVMAKVGEEFVAAD